MKLGHDINIFSDTRFKTHQRKALNKLFPHYIYTSNNPRFNGRGVAIFVNPYLDFTLIECKTDDQGNLLTVHCEIFGNDISLVVFYGPSGDSTFFYDRLVQTAREAYQTSENVLIAGDFNLFFDLNKDSFGYNSLPKPRGRALVNLLQTELNFADAFRHFHPQQFAVSWRKWNSLQGSRLDHNFISQELLQFVQGIEYFPPPLPTLDHCMCVTTIKFAEITSGRGVYRVPQGIENDPEYEILIIRAIKETMMNNYAFDAETSHLIQLIDQDNPDLTSVAALFKIGAWKARPGSVLHEVINAAKDISRRFHNSETIRQKKELSEILSRLKIAYHNLILFESERTFNAFYNTQLEYKTKVEEYINKKSNGKQTYIDIFGEKPTRFFFNARCNKKQRKPILKVKGLDGRVVEDKQGVTDLIVNFWSNLYNSETTQQQSVTNFLGVDAANLPKLTAEQKDSLEGPITETEVRCALFSLRNGAAAGFDGVGAAWFKKFYKILSPILLATYLDAYETGYIPEFFKYAIICLLPKAGSRTLVSNWRPISLLPTSYKIFGTLVARRLKPVLPSLIQNDQKAYVPKRLLYDIHFNIFSEINIAKKTGRKGNILSVDYKKAFDSVHLSSVEQTLQAFGFGPSFIGIAMLTLHGRSASVSINKELSQHFKIANGVPQGDPLAPYLFILLVEILLHKIRQSPDIISLNPGSLKVQSFADDLTLLLSDDIMTIRKAIQCIRNFTQVSGLDINLNKSVILPVNHAGYSAEDLDGLQQTDEMKLLGIFFDSDFKPTVRNSDSKFNRFNAATHKWSQAHLNLDGRLIIARSILTPIFTNLGILTEVDHGKLSWQLDKKINLYIWSGNHKVSVADTRLPKWLGGLNVINSAELWLNMRMKAFSRSFYEEESWALTVKQELADLNIETHQQIIEMNILDLELLKSRVSHPITIQAISDMVSFYKIYFKNNPQEILGERVFYNYFGSVRRTANNLPRPVTRHKVFNLYEGLRFELLNLPNEELTYFEFLDAYYGGRIQLNSKQTTYVAQFIRRISKIITPEMMATYKRDSPLSRKINSQTKLRKLLAPKNSNFDYQSFIYKRWDKRFGFFTPTLAGQLIANSEFKINDSRISDFKIRLNTCVLGFRKVVSKYRPVDPKCFLCSNSTATHDLSHTFYECDFARQLRSLTQSFLFLPQEFNLAIISEQDFFVGISKERAQQLGLDHELTNKFLLLIKYSLWICSLEESEQYCIDKAVVLTRCLMNRLIRKGRL